MGGLEWWHWVIIGLAFLLIFGGYKKLPSATKSIAQSLKIFKDETKGLRGEDDEPAAGDTATQHPQHDNAGALAAPQLSAPVPQPVAPASVPPVEQPVAQQPVAPQPVAQQPVAQQPVAPQPVVVAAPAPLAPASLAPQPGAYAGKRQSS